MAASDPKESLAIREFHTSTFGRFGWFCTLLFVALPAYSQDAGDGEQDQFQPLELLDRDVVRKNHVRTVTVSMSSGRKQKTDDSESCLVESFEFDGSGNLVLYSPPLVSSDYYFSYNENNELVDFGRVGKDGGTYSLAGDLERTPSLVDAYEAERVAAGAAIIRSVSSACFTIDAAYRFSPEFDETGLPTSAPAQKIRELDSGVFRENSSVRSPDELSTKFSYETRISP